MNEFTVFINYTLAFDLAEQNLIVLDLHRNPHYELAEILAYEFHYVNNIICIQAYQELCKL